MLMFTATAAWADHELKGRNIVLGREIYVQNCAACHGTNLEGQPSWRSSNEVGMSPAPPHDVTGHTWHHDIYTHWTQHGAIATGSSECVTAGSFLTVLATS